jgi:hypothetical protein
MTNTYNINSILNAVNEINLKPNIKIKKKTFTQNNFSNVVDQINLKPNIKIKKNTLTQNNIPKLNQNLKLSPDIDKLIQEAETHKKKLSKTYSKINYSQNKSIQNKVTQKFMIEDSDNDPLILNDEFVALKELKKKDSFNRSKYRFNSKKYILHDEVITSLKIQDSSIDILNKKLISFKKSEEKLLLQIIDLEQDKTLLLLQVKKFGELRNYANIKNNTKEILKSIYAKVKKQKQSFINLKNYSIKTEQESNVYKDNYEKLVVENDNIKKRLINAKDQIVTYENKKQEFLQSINQLNEILSKTNVVKNISSVKQILEKNIIKKGD